MGSSEIFKSKKNKKRRVVSFDEEVITKGSAVKHEAKVKHLDVDKNKKETCVIESGEIISHKSALKIETSEEASIGSNAKISESHKTNKRKKCSQLNEIAESNENSNEEQLLPIEQKKIKKRKQKIPNELKTEENPEKNDHNISAKIPETKKELSIRAQKRRKHAKLLEEKQLKAAVMTQQNVLNYLSKWKHSRDEWKFEKLKQIWLQQNLFDSSKVPDEFWETAVNYFSASKGFIRKCVLRDALKIIEKEENSQDEDASENDLKLKRARDIIQSLQE